MEQTLAQTGIVFGIQPFSLDDGPGIRTTVFLKGCNANCLCHRRILANRHAMKHCQPAASLNSRSR